MCFIPFIFTAENAMNRPALFALLLLTACQATLPETFTAQNLQLVIYHDSLGNRTLPIARRAGEKRQTAWRNWLASHRNQWQNGNIPVSGSTHWCAQWLENGAEQRICKRHDNHHAPALVWFGNGVLRDAEAIGAADRIWAGRLATEQP